MNETTVFTSPIFAWNQTLAMTEIDALETMMEVVPDDTILEEKRTSLKKQLARTAITNLISEEEEDTQPQGLYEEDARTAESITSSCISLLT